MLLFHVLIMFVYYCLLGPIKLNCSDDSCNQGWYAEFLLKARVYSSRNFEQLRHLMKKCLLNWARGVLSLFLFLSFSQKSCKSLSQVFARTLPPGCRIIGWKYICPHSNLYPNEPGKQVVCFLLTIVGTS